MELSPADKLPRKCPSAERRGLVVTDQRRASLLREQMGLKSLTADADGENMGVRAA